MYNVVHVLLLYRTSTNPVLGLGCVCIHAVIFVCSVIFVISQYSPLHVVSMDSIKIDHQALSTHYFVASFPGPLKSLKIEQAILGGGF